MVVSATLCFMLYIFVRQSDVFSKKDRSIWWIFCLNEGFYCVYVCLSLYAFEYLYVFMCALARTYVYTYICAYSGTHLYIFPLSVVGKGWGKRRECEKGRVSRELREKLLQSKWFLFLFFLPNFLIAKGLFDVNMKSLFCGESYWEMTMIQIKIITLLFKKNHFLSIFYNDNDCDVKGYIV